MKLQEKPFPISRRIAGESQIGSGHYQEPSGLSASGAAGRWSRAAFLRAVGKAALGCGAGLGVLAFSCQARAGGLYQDGTTSQQTTDFAIPYVSSALSFRISVPGVGTGRRDASAAFLNSRYAVTAAHNVTDLLQYNPTYAVADGTNFLTNRGNIMVVTDVTFHPTLDLAILKFAAPFQPTTNKVIGTANVGDTAYSAGFGQWGTPSTGLISPRDGNLRAFDARVSDTVYNASAPYYQSATFGFTTDTGLTLPARAANGDSGGPVFTAQGQLIGIMIYASTDLGPGGTTTYLRLGEPSTKAWIEAHTTIPTPVLGIARTASGISVTWDSDAIGWILQRSETFPAWSDIGTTITAPGSYTDTSGAPQAFFRLRRN